jgi:hypothetical protein
LEVVGGFDVGFLGAGVGGVVAGEGFGVLQGWRGLDDAISTLARDYIFLGRSVGADDTTSACGFK